MAKEPLTITIDPDSELGRALDQTDWRTGRLAAQRNALPRHPRSG